MDFLQFGACAAGFVALEDLNVVFEVELFEEPDNALGAGLLEPVFCGQQVLLSREKVCWQCQEAIEAISCCGWWVKVFTCKTYQ